jgi:DNA-binding GntR family transcriptional regulator
MKREDRVFSLLGHTSRTVHVTALLRAAILDGSLQPGTPLLEGQLAASLGVSRAPVREALRSLEKEGLVTKNMYSGAFVAAARPEAMREATSVRVRIEPYAIERSLPVFIAEGFTRLEQQLQQLDKFARSGHAGLAVDAHQAFHRAFYEAADHQLLLDAWRALEPAIRLHLLSIDWSLRDTELWIRSHSYLLDVIKSGSEHIVEQAVVDHVTSVDDPSSNSHNAR